MSLAALTSVQNTSAASSEAIDAAEIRLVGAGQPLDDSALGPITVRAAPKREPPFDDEVAHLHLVGPLDRPLPFGAGTEPESWIGKKEQGTGNAPDSNLASGPSRAPGSNTGSNDGPESNAGSNGGPGANRSSGSIRSRGARDGIGRQEQTPGRATLAEASRSDPFGYRATPRADLPDPVAFSRRLLVGALEAFAGHRSIAQLSPYLSRGVFTGLARDAENPQVTNSWRGNAAVRTLHLCEPADGVAEVAAVIAVRGRSRAVALRLEGLDGRWRCVRLQLG